MRPGAVVGTPSLRSSAWSSASTSPWPAAARRPRGVLPLWSCGEGRGVERRGFATAVPRRSLSWAEGPSEPALLTETIPDHFASVVAQHGDRTAVISRAQRQRLTYAELDAQSNRLAHGLQQRGVAKGERVAVSLGNNIEFAVTTYALFKLGAILVPLNPAFSVTQVISALSHLDAAHLVIGTETNLPFKPPRENVSLLRQLVPDLSSSHIESAAVPSLRSIILVDNSESRVQTELFAATTRFRDVMSGSEAAVRPDAPLQTDDIVNIQFTSGTTSMPKAACLTHHSILNNGFLIGERMKLTPDDVVCCPPPLFHCFGSVLGYMATATHGSAIVFPTEAFNPEAALRAVQEERATALYGVTTMFVAELDLLANGTVPHQGFERLRTGIAAGSSVPSNIMKKLHETLNLTGLTICYGMTETSPVSCMTTPDDPLAKRLETVGSVMPHTTAKVVSVHDRNEILPRGEKGELVVSGYLVMKGYWGDEERTKEARVVDETDGRAWMHTGDEALIDDDGFVQITGRIKDLIIRGGENIHPLEVENCLFAHPHISEVSVVGLPDERYGECVAAFIIPHHGVVGDGDPAVDAAVVTQDELRAWVRSRLSGHLVPKHVFWIHELPKTASGKIQKFKLQEQGMALLRSAVDSA